MEERELDRDLNQNQNCKEKQNRNRDRKTRRVNVCQSLANLNPGQSENERKRACFTQLKREPKHELIHNTKHC